MLAHTFTLLQGVVLDLEFYKVLDAHPNIADAVEQGAEIEITFMTQLEAKRKYVTRPLSFALISIYTVVPVSAGFFSAP